jgi:hypothetical protein
VSRTHDLAEWAAFLSLGISVHASFSVFWFLLVDAHRSDFDPRPALARAVNSEAVYPLLREFDNAKHAAHRAAVRVQRAPLDAALSAAALLALLLPASPNGATR